MNGIGSTLGPCLSGAASFGEAGRPRTIPLFPLFGSGVDTHHPMPEKTTIDVGVITDKTAPYEAAHFQQEAIEIGIDLAA